MVIYKTLAQRFFVIPHKGLNMGHLYKTVYKPFLKPFLLTVQVRIAPCIAHYKLITAVLQYLHYKREADVLQSVFFVEAQHLIYPLRV